MSSTKKQWIISISIIVLLIIGSWVFFAWRNKGGKEENQNMSQTKIDNKDADKEPAQDENTWTGTLKLSDNQKKGTLMLVMEKQTIYINTSRDYSQLIGKNVKVTYEGTLDSFVLGDIVQK